MQKLKVIADPGRLSRRKAAEHYFDRLWLINPAQFDPDRNIKERERIARTLALLQNVIGKRVVDLGCGGGKLARSLADLGAKVDAIDVSSNALKSLSGSPIYAQQDYVPTTKLVDEAYDIVLCTDLIGFLPREEHRMLFSELSRLVKPDGSVICSSAMDIDTLNPVQQFANLAETEFKIEKWVFSYHLLWIRLKDFFHAPSRFVRGSTDPEYRLHALKKRRSFSNWWFKVNSRPVLALFWRGVNLFCTPIVKLLKTNRSLLLFLEKATRLFWSDAGISHALFLGKRRPLYVPPPENEQPRETKHKKQLWE